MSPEKAALYQVKSPKSCTEKQVFWGMVAIMCSVVGALVAKLVFSNLQPDYGSFYNFILFHFYQFAFAFFIAAASAWVTLGIKERDWKKAQEKFVEGLNSRHWENFVWFFQFFLPYPATGGQFRPPRFHN